MNTPHDLLAKKLATHLRQNKSISGCDFSDQKVQIAKSNGELVVLDLTAFIGVAQEPTAQAYFHDVTSIKSLLEAYSKARQDYAFEDSLKEAMLNVSSYASQFIDTIFDNAVRDVSDEQAKLIADFAKNLDVYTAVKSIESLLYSRADLKLLEIAKTKNWNLHYDHMAIRCGTQSRQDAERIAQLLTSQHGYVASQVEGEAFYQFPEGWNAYPLYKILTNGQILRVFIDQSDGSSSQQIIQHWNKVYGYTAHHLGISATRLAGGQKLAVPIEDIIAALAQHALVSMEPTGMYTQGLLQQVFTKPEKNLFIPEELKAQIAAYGEGLTTTIQNAKLLEIVSRKEMPLELAKEFFALYGLQFDVNNVLHSAPIYQYFLPAQAAHVIKTSTQIERAS